MELEATDDQLDAPFLYASARDGWCSVEPTEQGGDLSPLFRAVVDSVPPPSGLPGAPFQMLVSTLDYSPYLGRMAIGRIENGVVRDGDTVAVWALDADAPEPAVRIPKLYIYEAVSRVEVEEAQVGQIVAIAGVEAAEIGSTLCDPESPARLEGIAVEPPTLSVDFRPNTSPFAGRSGRFVTSRQLRERLFREVHSNVALRVDETEDPDRFRVSGRGELHLSILMETMRREGYEFSVSRPHVITHLGEDGSIEEPYEEVVADVPEGMIGVVMSGLGERRGEMVDMEKGDGGLVRLRFSVPSRALTGYRSEFLTETRGEGTLHRQFERYGPWAGDLEVRTTGALVSMTEGVATAYSLFNLQERGKMFVRPVEAVYNGMIVGEHSRENDLEVNVIKGKKLSNVRASGADDAIVLEPPREITLEYALEFIRDDELVEVTPDAIRLRKRMLTSHERKRDRRAVKAD
jgi:GTP-binding protein